MSRKECPSCRSLLKSDAHFCPSCGASIPANTESVSPRLPQDVSPKKAMSKRTKAIYTGLATVLFGIFVFLFISHLPGGAHPVIAQQPEIAMASMFTDVKLSPVPIVARVRAGKIVFPLSLLLTNKLVEFEYQSGTFTVPLLAFISPEGKLVTAVRICEPCNSHSFRIEGTELACGNCETRWKLSNLEGLQGSCQKYPPAPIPSEVVGNVVQIDENIVKNWKIRI